MFNSSNAKKNTRSKLDRFPNYKVEFEINRKIFDKAVKTHVQSLECVDIDSYASTHNGNEFFPYINYRIEDLLVSVTDDLIRYAQYHDISIDYLEDGAEIYSISENVRASFFAKWIIKLKPSILDYLASTGEYRSSKLDSDEALSEFREDQFLEVKFCNEVLALITLTVILNTKDQNLHEKVIWYDKLFSSLDMPTVFYALRYRIVHQDSYTLLFSKIAHALEEA